MPNFMSDKTNKGNDDTYHCYKISKYRCNYHHRQNRSLERTIADRATPKYLSLASMMSIVCPSFELDRQALNELGVHGKCQVISRLSAFWGAIGLRLGIFAQLGPNQE